MQDRVSLYPGRVTLTPVAGQANTYDMVRADQPTQEGTQLNKGNLLSDATAELLGLPSTAVPNDAFAKLALGTGKYGYSIKVVDPSGNPLSGITVSGVETPLGQTAVTGENGTVLGVSTETSVSVSVTSPYFDLNSASQTVQSTGIVTEVTLTLTEKYAENEIITVSSSATARFSPRVKKVDFCAIGGGGGGGWSSGGGGGGGGYVENLLDRTVSPEEVYTLTVGSGGTAGSNPYGGSGGQSSINLNGSTLASANGGSGAGTSNPAVDGRPGGTGNGNGGTGNSRTTEEANGKAGTVNLFNDASLGLAGGGGGGGGYYVNESGTVCGEGGAPYGGRGGINGSTPGQGGRGPGGGGGGSTRQNNTTSGVGYGANGAIKLRMRFTA